MFFARGICEGWHKGEGRERARIVRNYPEISECIYRLTPISNDFQLFFSHRKYKSLRRSGIGEFLLRATYSRYPHNLLLEAHFAVAKGGRDAQKGLLFSALWQMRKTQV